MNVLKNSGSFYSWDYFYTRKYTMIRRLSLNICIQMKIMLVSESNYIS